MRAEGLRLTEAHKRLIEILAQVAVGQFLEEQDGHALEVEPTVSVAALEGDTEE